VPPIAYKSPILSFANVFSGQIGSKKPISGKKIGQNGVRKAKTGVGDAIFSVFEGRRVGVPGRKRAIQPLTPNRLRTNNVARIRAAGFLAARRTATQILSCPIAVQR
jgi:hypothetical protein